MGFLPSRASQPSLLYGTGRGHEVKKLTSNHLITDCDFVEVIEAVLRHSQEPGSLPALKWKRTVTSISSLPKIAVSVERVLAMCQLLCETPS